MGLGVRISQTPRYRQTSQPPHGHSQAHFSVPPHLGSNFQKQEFQFLKFPYHPLLLKKLSFLILHIYIEKIEPAGPGAH
jgi:hypothetical protein